MATEAHTYPDVLALNEYRCTRAALANNAPKCDRQGHYIRAKDEHEARVIMQRKFPNDKALGETFTVDLWKAAIPMGGR